MQHQIIHNALPGKDAQKQLFIGFLSRTLMHACATVIVMKELTTECLGKLAWLATYVDPVLGSGNLVILSSFLVVFQPGQPAPKWQGTEARAALTRSTTSFS